MDPDIKKALDALQASFGEFKRVNDERLAAMEKGQGVAELNAKLSRIEEDVAKNQKILDDFSAKVNRESLGLAGGMNPSDAALVREFNAWAHEGGGRSEFRAAATSDNNPSGGFFVLPELEAGMDRVASTVAVLRQLADVRGIGSAEAKMMVGTGGAGGGWVGERDTRSTTDSPNEDEISIPIREVYANPKAAQDLIDDASEDVAAWLEDEAGIKIGELEGAAFIAGNTPKRPRGILAYDMIANASFAWGKVGYIATGTSAAFDATNPADAILSLIYALKPEYRNGAAFLAEDTTIAAIRKFKNTYGYLWQPSLVAGEPSTLAGYPVHSDGNMPIVAANSYSLAFGNWKRGYAIRDRAGIKVLRDPYTTKGYVEFYTTKRVGGGIKNFEAIKLLKFAAS
jgi:HK97 family phage major capsid protein